MRWVCSTNGEKRNAYRTLLGKLEGKRPLERPIYNIILRWIFGRWDREVWSGLI
jgi:hypothetical protein